MDMRTNYPSRIVSLILTCKCGDHGVIKHDAINVQILRMRGEQQQEHMHLRKYVHLCEIHG